MLKILFCALAAAALTVQAIPGTAESREITARTEVTKWGQMPVAFEVKGQALPEGVPAGDFTITGEAASWGTEATHPFLCGVKSVSAAEDGWTLVPDAFPEKYFYVRKMDVTCSSHPELSFSMEEIGRTVTPVADSFETVEDPECRMKARVFMPETGEPCPVVIVFHGYGDTENLLTYRTAAAWAEPSFQAEHSCIVIAPVIDNMLYGSEFARASVIKGVMKLADRLVEEGKADPGRIYVMGNSFGGMSSFELAELFPGRIAGILALCPALNYSPQGMKRLPELADVPVFIAQAENDETISSEVGKTAAKMLEDAGNTQVRLRIYSDAEMEAAGARFGSEETYSFHHVELAVMEDSSYAEWLFSQKRQ